MAKTFPIELDEDLHKRLKIDAIEEGLTLHDWIVRVLEEKVVDNGTGARASAKRKGNNERKRNR